MRFLFLLTFLLSLGSSVLAQSACPLMEDAALGEATVWCSDLPSGTLCYGNAPLQAEIGTDASFRSAGDQVPLTKVDTLRGIYDDSALSVAVAQVPVVAASSWQTEDMALLALGTFSIQNLGQALPPLVQVSAAQGANIRSGPGTEFRVVRPAAQNDVLALIGQSSSGDWLQIVLRDGGAGWISASAFSSLPDDLPMVEAGAAGPDVWFGPFSDIAFSSTAGDARCAEAPASGLILQAPAESEPLLLRVNDILLRFDGTVWVQGPDDDLLFHALEGIVSVQIGGDEILFEEARTLRVYPGEDGSLLAADPVVIDPALALGLPLGDLPRGIYAPVAVETIITPRPLDGSSPLSGMLATDACRITTGEGGSNLRGGPGTDYPIRGVLDFRQSANPIGRAFGTDGSTWWQLAPDLWISAATTVTGGDCAAVPEVPYDPPR